MAAVLSVARRLGVTADFSEGQERKDKRTENYNGWPDKPCAMVLRHYEANRHG